MLGFKDRGNSAPRKFKPSDLAFTVKDLEKVIILKTTEPGDERNKDLGTCYLVRGDEDRFKVFFEFELLTLKEHEDLAELRAT